MSATATFHPALQGIVAALDQNLHMYAADLKPIPEDKYAWVPMGTPRTVQALTAEVIGVNFASAAILRGEATLSEEEATARYASLSKADALRLLSESVEDLKSALADLSPDDFETVVTAPWGAPVQKMQLAAFMPYHLCYHDGQLNYIHTLYGDMAFHWHD